MPVRPTYPGVYIEEVPSGVRTIVGVATSVTAFIGYFSKGPMDEARRILSWSDFERDYGGLRIDSEASYAVQQFFLNGGTEAWVVRTAQAGTVQVAAIQIADSATGGAPVLLVTAVDPGAWGNNIRIDVDHGTTDPANRFDLNVTLVGTVGGRLQTVTTESFRNLSLDPLDREYVVDVVENGSKLIRVDLVGAPANLPAETGTVSARFTAAQYTALGLAAGDTMNVTVNDAAGVVAGPLPVVLVNPVPATIPGFAAYLQGLLRAVDPELANATVTVLGTVTPDSYFQVKAGRLDPGSFLTFTGPLAVTLGLDAAASSNVQQYQLGAAVAVGAQLLPGAASPGLDGNPPGAAELVGSEAGRTGIFALAPVDTFNILCIPDTMLLPDVDAAQVIAAAEAWCERRRAFYIVDVPQDDRIRDEVDEVKAWLDDNATLRHRNAALYFPRVLMADPLNSFRLRTVPSSGTLAGLYARTDGERGVWKAPAGTEAKLRGVQRLEYRLNDLQNGVLNPVGINCLRSFDVYGNVSWGARTLEGADQMASDWKYVPVRRLALYLEESLFRGTQWVVFEPNDEPLWAQIRLNLGAFMHSLFRQGAFQGSSPREAYLVKCDRETTTQDDINKGIVNILVGFAPLKPAEFVIIRIQQLAGQIQT
jgi:phage tail sheath protein FI